jgi:hypothetical protein
MPHAATRFECLPDTEGTWMVWDNETGAPATLGGCELRGRQKERAEVACGILTRIFTNRMDAKAVKSDTRRPDRNGTEADRAE